MARARWHRQSWYRADLHSRRPHTAIGRWPRHFKTVIAAADRYVHRGSSTPFHAAAAWRRRTEARPGLPVTGSHAVFVNPRRRALPCRATRNLQKQRSAPTWTVRAATLDPPRMMEMSDRDPNASELARMVELAQGNDRRRRWPVERVVLRARQLLEDRRGGRDGEGHCPVRRRLLEPHPR